MPSSLSTMPWKQFGKCKHTNNTHHLKKKHSTPSAKQLKHSKPKRIMKRTGRKKQTMPKSAAPPSSKGKSVILKQPSINSLALSRNLCLSPTPMHKLQHTRGPRHLPAREASNSQS